MLAASATLAALKSKIVFIDHATGSKQLLTSPICYYLHLEPTICPGSMYLH